MNPGDSVQDASRSGIEDGTVPGALGHDDSHQARSLRAQKHLQDIQDLIDKLAAPSSCAIRAAALTAWRAPRARPPGAAAAARCRPG